MSFSEKLEHARGRQRLYRLLGDLFLHGVTPRNFSMLRLIPALGEKLPETADFDQLGVEHQQLFGFLVFPYEGAFRSPDCLIGGEATSAVITTFQKIGFEWDTGDVSADHVGVHCMALSFLCAAEADAWEDQKSAIAAQMSQKRINLLTTHLARWLPPFAAAVSRENISPYRVAVDLLLELVDDDLAEHRATITPPIAETKGPAMPLSLSDQDVGLKDIGEHLMTPLVSGWFLSRNTLRDLGRVLELPQGFGPRNQQLFNLFRAAAQYDQSPLLLAKLNEIASIWLTVYQAQSGHYPDLSPFVIEWEARLSHTFELLAEMAEKLTLNIDAE